MERDMKEDRRKATPRYVGFRKIINVEAVVLHVIGRVHGQRDGMTRN